MKICWKMWILYKKKQEESENAAFEKKRVFVPGEGEKTLSRRAFFVSPD